MSTSTVLAALLITNALVGFGYRVYRWKAGGGPSEDVIGQGVLGALLVALAIAVAAGIGWARWIGLVYAGLFALIVMPIWVLAVLIPGRPGTIDYAFTALYEALLIAIAIAAIAA